MQNSTNVDICIVGGGPVGIFAAFQIGMLDMTSAIVESLPYLGGQCSALYPEKPIFDIPAHPEITGENLIQNLISQVQRFDPVILLNHSLESVLQQPDGNFVIQTSLQTKINCKAIVLAVGHGSFIPNRPPLENITHFENKSVFYSISNHRSMIGKNITIAGGGDSAVDWAIFLHDKAKKLNIIHRRNTFKCCPNNLNQLMQLAEDGKLEIHHPYQLKSLTGEDGMLESVTISNIENESHRSIDTDILLPFFGLSNDLGYIAKMNLELKNKHIVVNQETMQTSKNNIYAIGDVATYPGKLNLILTGFSEAAIAAHNVYKIVHPDKALHFEHSTTKMSKK